MFSKYLERNDTLNLIKKINNDPKFYSKEFDGDIYYYASYKEICLFSLYDAIYKFYIVIDDEDLYSSYIEDLENLYRKIDNYSDILLGINRLICLSVARKLNIKELTNDLSKKEIVSYVYNKYIVDGYYIYGVDNIENGPFMPEKYNDLYNDMKKINEIFSKYKIDNIIDKDFSSKSISYTDSVISACYFSRYSPIYFYDFLLNNCKYRKDVRNNHTLVESYDKATTYLKRLMSLIGVSDSEREYILSVVSKEWKTINRDNNIYLIFVKRRDVNQVNNSFDDYIDGDVYECVDRILSSKGNIPSDKIIEDYKVVRLRYYKNENTNNDNDIVIDNDFGKASLFMIVGSLLISLGVLIMIIILLRGGSL